MECFQIFLLLYITNNSDFYLAYEYLLYILQYQYFNNLTNSQLTNHQDYLQLIHHSSTDIK